MHKITNFSKILAVAPKSLTSTEAASLTVSVMIMISTSHYKSLSQQASVRFQSTQPSAAARERQEKKEKAMKKKAVNSKSFVQNVFRGMIVPDQAFPYPQPLDEEQKENLQMLVPIAERVMAEQNDPLVNDAQESVPEATVQALRELGAFGLQVLNQYSIGLFSYR